MNYKLSCKRGEKWMTFGNIKPSPKGTLQASIRITPDFLALVEESKAKGWLNFAMFEDTYAKTTVKPGYKGQDTDLDDQIPFK